MTMDEFSWNLVYRLLRTDDIHIGDVQSRDEHKKDEVIRHIYLVPSSMPVPWTSHLPSFSSWTTYLDNIRLEIFLMLSIFIYLSYVFHWVIHYFLLFYQVCDGCLHALSTMTLLSLLNRLPHGFYFILGLVFFLLFYLAIIISLLLEYNGTYNEIINIIFIWVLEYNSSFRI